MNRRTYTVSNVAGQQPEEEKTKKKYIPTVLLIISLVIILGVSYFLFFSSFFKIQSVQFSGERYVDKSSITKYFQNAFNSNLLLFSIDTNKFLQKFPIIQSVIVQKNYPSQLYIKIKEFPPFMLLQTSQSTYVFSEYGIQLDKTVNSSTKYSLPLVLTSEQSLNHVDYSLLSKFIKKLEEDKSEFITNFQFESPYTLSAIYTDGHEVTVSLNKSLTDQMNEISRVKQYVGFTDCHYLDVRFSSVYCRKQS